MNKYDVWSRKNEDGAKIIMLKKLPASKWTAFSCWFDTSSDELHNVTVSQALNVSSLETVKSLWCIHREFSYKSTGETIVKISPHLPKLLTNIISFEILCIYSTHLDWIITACNTSILNLDMRWWMCIFAFIGRARTISTCKFSADFKRQPARIFANSTSSRPHHHGTSKWWHHSIHHSVHQPNHSTHN